MDVGEKKICPRCKKEFICNAADIAKCRCSAVVLNEEARRIIAEGYEGCLCVECLKEIQVK